MQAGLREGGLKVQEPLVPARKNPGAIQPNSSRREAWRKRCGPSNGSRIFLCWLRCFSRRTFLRRCAVGRALAAFFLFCLASSSVYLLNDIRDREQDRLHPQKRHRPHCQR